MNSFNCALVLARSWSLGGGSSGSGGTFFFLPGGGLTVCIFGFQSSRKAAKKAWRRFGEVFGPLRSFSREYRLHPASRSDFAVWGVEIRSSHNGSCIPPKGADPQVRFLKQTPVAPGEGAEPMLQVATGRVLLQRSAVSEEKSSLYRDV